MVKPAKTISECQACGATSPKCLGRCQGWGGWNTRRRRGPTSARWRSRQMDGARRGCRPGLVGRRAPWSSGGRGAGRSRAPTSYVETHRHHDRARRADRALVFVVRGGVTLLGGASRIGKSTLLMQRWRHGDRRAPVALRHRRSVCGAGRSARAAPEDDENFEVLATTDLTTSGCAHAKPTFVPCSTRSNLRSAELVASAVVAQLATSRRG